LLLLLKLYRIVFGLFAVKSHIYHTSSLLSL
jgi:hypothetical protein